MDESRLASLPLSDMSAKAATCGPDSAGEGRIEMAVPMAVREELAVRRAGDYCAAG